MALCPKCERFAERFNIRERREYRDIARQLIEIVNQGTFLIVRAVAPWGMYQKNIGPGTSLPTISSASPVGGCFIFMLTLIMGTRAGQLVMCQNRKTIIRNQIESG